MIRFIRHFDKEKNDIGTKISAIIQIRENESVVCNTDENFPKLKVLFSNQILAFNEMNRFGTINIAETYTLEVGNYYCILLTPYYDLATKDVIAKLNKCNFMNDIIKICEETENYIYIS